MPARTINGLAAQASRRKRARDAGLADDDDDADDHVVEVQQARSNFRTEPVSSPALDEAPPSIPPPLLHLLLSLIHI